MDPTNGAGAQADPDVVVIGGGLAGITAALDCAEAGARVRLLEVRRRLGGAAYSFERDGIQMDNGQHVFLRCCAAYRALLRRLGAQDGVRLQERLEIPVLRPGHAPLTLRRGSLPAPAHLAGTLLRYRHISPAQRARAVRAVAALRRLDPHEEALERQTFGQWLGERGQDAEAVARLWDLIALPTLNLPAAQASPGLSAFVFQTALLARADAGDIGFHERPLSETLAVPAERALRDAGVDVRLAARAQTLARDHDGLRVGIAGGGAGDAGREAGAAGKGAVSGGGEAGAADEPGETRETRVPTVIVALPHERAANLLRDVAPAIAAGLARLRSSPIVNLHVVYDRPVCEHRFAAGVDSPVQYLFDRTRAGGVPAGCQYLAVSLSGAEREMEMSVDALRERYLPALAALLPRARDARVETFLVTREHAATFRAAPGVARLRPAARTPVPGLLLAGSWTDTGWPATLEGAVLSGHAAAREALEALSRRRSRHQGDDQ